MSDCGGLNTEEKRLNILNNFQNEESLEKRNRLLINVKCESERCLILVTKCLEVLNNGGNDKG